MMLFRILGNIGILAKFTRKIAPYRSERKDIRPRQKMKHRFFFDRINIDRGRKAVGKEIKFSVFDFAYTADSVFPFGKLTVLIARLACNSAVFEFV